MDVGQTALKETEIEKHLAVAQSLVTQFVVVSSGKAESNTEIAGTRRRFVSTVSTTGTKSTNKVELTNTIGAINAGDGMLSLAQQHPGYGWETNMGYGSKSHMSALQNLGPTPHHRRSFKPVHNML